MNKLLRAGIASVAPLFALFAVPAAGQDLPPGLYARFDTDKGAIVCQLFFQQTPMTVANFVGLAEGTLATDVRQGQPFYDGLTFHRVIADFMIQGGDPKGDGTGGPGYRFADEFRPFFITHVPTPHLDGRHTVFGKVVAGQDVVDSIAKGDVIRKLTIIRVGPEAEAFRPDQAEFERLQAGGGASADASSGGGAAASGRDAARMIRDYEKKAKTSMSGLKYVVVQKGEGAKPRPGQTIETHYTGRLMDGTKFDSSLDRGQPFAFKVGKGEVIAGWDEALSDMKVGEKRALIVPAKLGYGSRGAGGVIPPDATLFFEVERMK